MSAEIDRRVRGLSEQTFNDRQKLVAAVIDVLTLCGEPLVFGIGPFKYDIPTELSNRLMKLSDEKVRLVVQVIHTRTS